MPETKSVLLETMGKICATIRSNLTARYEQQEMLDQLSAKMAVELCEAFPEIERKEPFYAMAALLSEQCAEQYRADFLSFKDTDSIMYDIAYSLDALLEKTVSAKALSLMAYCEIYFSNFNEAMEYLETVQDMERQNMPLDGCEDYWGLIAFMYGYDRWLINKGEPGEPDESFE